jgi:hypothetical protein
VPAQALVSILVHAIMVLVMLMFDLDRNGPGARHGREIKDGGSQQDEREKFFHNGLSAYVLDCIEDATGRKEFFGSTISRQAAFEKDYLSLWAG